MIGKTISHYEIIEKLGEGGMGIVYKAHDTKLDRTVALKFLPSHLTASEEDKQRFIREAKAAAALNHPNICTIHNVDEYDGKQFIVMEYIDGVTLREKMADVGSHRDAPLQTMIEFSIQIAKALAEAHEKGIVQRDIKPENIMVDSKNRIKVMDFGLAKLAGRTMITKEGTTLGTIVYMSPEQARGDEADQRSDIWSLGVVLYEMITGQHPFKGEYDQVVIYNILNEDPQSITSLRTDVPKEFEHIVNKCLQKQATHRYQHVDDLLADLRAIARDREIHPTTLKSRSLSLRTVWGNRIFAFGFIGMLAIILLVVASRLGFLMTRPDIIGSIAVLPLDNFSDDEAQEYFADGMTEALIAELSQIGALRVISRTSVMQYKEVKKPLRQIARELNVDAVIEGSVMRSGDRVRITAQLINARRDQNLWAKSYEKDLSDLLTLQSEVARDIVQEINIKLTPWEQNQLTRVRQIDPEAHVTYLKGRYYWNKFTDEGFRQAIEYFNLAIEKDSSHALAWTGLADTYILFAVDGFMPPKEVMQKAKVSAAKALQIDDTLAEAYVSWGAYNMFFEWNWMEAEKAFRRAIELNPNSADAHHFYGHYLQAMGRVEEGITATKRALELDPLSLILNSELGWAIYFARRYDEAIAQYKKTLKMDPNFVFAVWSLAMAYSEYGMPEIAIEEMQKFEAVAEHWAVFLAEFGYAYALSGQKTKALEVLHQLEKRSQREFIDPALMVNIYTALGDTRQALDWLDKAYEERSCVWLPWLKVEPKFDPLRSEPRFIALLQKTGLDQ
jgi:eukaryotic-like serine/threonine-protein kinase